MAARILYWTGASALARQILARRGRLVVELHGVPARPMAGLPPSLQPRICRDELEAILEWLTSRFRLLTAEEFLEARTPGVLLTFDDGFANQADFALPLLERFRAPAVLFVSTRHVIEPTNWLPFVGELLAQYGSGRASDATLHELFDGMTEAQLLRCAESPLVTIGSHTVDHPMLTTCDDGELRRQLEESREFLERQIGCAVDLLAYPTGDYDARVAKAAQGAGYRAAFAENSRGVGLDRFEIPRVGLYGAESAYLGAKLSGLHRRPLPLLRGAVGDRS